MVKINLLLGLVFGSHKKSKDLFDLPKNSYLSYDESPGSTAEVQAGE